MVAILLILTPKLRQKPPLWSFLIAFPPYFALRAFLGYPIDMSRLPIIVTEVSAIGITIMLTRVIGKSLDQVQQIITDLTLGDLKEGTQNFESGQGWLYREIRRARTFERPAALLIVSPLDKHLNKHCENISDYFIRDAQNRVLNQYVSARTARFLREVLRDCDVITQRDDQFVILLPETDKQNVREITSKLRKAAQEKLNMDLQIGVSTFPDEAVTFEGLLKLAEKALPENPAGITVPPSINAYPSMPHEQLVRKSTQDLPSRRPTKESLALELLSKNEVESHAKSSESMIGKRTNLEN